MSDFVIIPDTGCELTKDLRERFGVDDFVRGQLIYPDGHSEPTDLDWTKTTPEEFFNIMSEKKQLFKTSLPTPEEIETVYERWLSAGKDILSINLSSGLSGTYSACCIGAKRLLEKYPDRKIICIDSKRYSAAISLLCLYANELRAAGHSLEETAQLVENRKVTLHQSGILDDLFFCKRMGRVSNAAAVMGTLVGIKPMADFNSDGLCKVIGKTRGYKAGYNASIAYMKETITNPEEQTVIVMQSNRVEEAKKYMSMIESEIHPKEIIMTSLGQACGPSIGPGLIAAVYFGTELSSDLSAEKAILDRILQKK